MPHWSKASNRRLKRRYTVDYSNLSCLKDTVTTVYFSSRRSSPWESYSLRACKRRHTAVFLSFVVDFRRLRYFLISGGCFHWDVTRWAEHTRITVRYRYFKLILLSITNCLTTGQRTRDSVQIGESQAVNSKCSLESLRALVEVLRLPKNGFCSVITHAVVEKVTQMK